MAGALSYGRLYSMRYNTGPGKCFGKTWPAGMEPRKTRMKCGEFGGLAPSRGAAKEEKKEGEK